MTPAELIESLKVSPLTDEEMAAIMRDAATLEVLEDLDEAEFDRIMESAPCLCVGRFVCTHCKVVEKLS